MRPSAILERDFDITPKRQRTTVSRLIRLGLNWRWLNKPNQARIIFTRKLNNSTVLIHTIKERAKDSRRLCDSQGKFYTSENRNHSFSPSTKSKGHHGRIADIWVDLFILDKSFGFESGWVEIFIFIIKHRPILIIAMKHLILLRWKCRSYQELKITMDLLGI